MNGIALERATAVPLCRLHRPLRDLAVAALAILSACCAGGTSIAADEAAPTVRSVRESLDEARGLLDDGKPAKSAARLASTLQDIAAIGAKGGRPPSGLRGLLDRCRELRDDLELEGVDVKALEIPSLRAGGNAEPKGEAAPAVRPRPAAPAKPAVAAIGFTSQVAPILVRHCGGCHVSGRRGGFQMASFGQLAASGMVQPGAANSSRLVEVILSGDMPRGGGKVPPEDLGVLMRWIDAGAPFDGLDRGAGIDAFSQGAAAGQLAGQQPPKKPTVAVRLNPGDVSFAADVAPILLAQCAGCHDADQPEANLSMITLEGLLRGGRRGPPVVAGKSAESLLVKKIKGQGIEGQRMPIGKPPLSDDVVAMIGKWIDQGVKLDALSPKDPLETIAAVGRARKLGHDELAKVRVDAGRKLWTSALPDEEPRFERRKLVAVIGNLPASRMAELADDAEALAGRIRDELVGGDQPLLKGDIVLYVFAKGYDYSGFWQHAMLDERPRGLNGNAAVLGDVAYAAVLATGGDGDEEDGRLLMAEQLAAAALVGRAAPAWFVGGAGRALALKAAAKAPLARTWRRDAAEGLQQLGSAADFFQGHGDRQAILAVGGGFVGSLAATGGRLRSLVKELDAGTDFEAAFAAAFRGPPQPLFEAWAAKEARRPGRP
ncbi:MAG: hypothetical protein EBZ59_01915 [Planctomycetia bacterium]|nr:hypothetical protein [Planctomycetia bacterium]